MPEALLELEEVAEQRQTRQARRTGGGDPPRGGGDGWNPGRPAPPARVYTTGMLVAFAASSIFFASLISAAVVHRGLPGSDWITFQAPGILWVSTAVALLSSLTIMRARRLFLAGQPEGFRRWWLMSAALGVAFLALQTTAWHQLTERGFYLTSNPSVSFFYVLTVSHGLHLLGGVLALLWIGLRRPRHVGPAAATAAAALYWHFVTAVWLFLFCFFLIGG